MLFRSVLFLMMISATALSLLSAPWWVIETMYSPTWTLLEVFHFQQMSLSESKLRIPSSFIRSNPPLAKLAMDTSSSLSPEMSVMEPDSTCRLVSGLNSIHALLINFKPTRRGFKTCSCKNVIHDGFTRRHFIRLRVSR